MKKLLLLALVVAAVYFWQLRDGLMPTLAGSATPAASAARYDAIAAAFDDRQSGVQVAGEGIVSRILSDDNDGSRHQRFILTLDSGQTVLVSHNIDLAPRIEMLREGDAVSFNGVYEWNDRGGIVHWTHHDPEAAHEAGWLRHGGQVYE
jgi:uncharacterized protein DUF3465